ncbi:MAG TPA: ABC transporter permease [Steroidobacteraceae bacterium]|nr:ABC transporter permease [Steroidobacteraceae bacterium]
MRAFSAARIWEMVRKEFLQLRRNPLLLRLLLVSPIIQLVLFGYAVSTDVHNATTFVVDQSNTQESRQLLEAMTASGYFRISGGSADPADMVSALDHGAALVGVAIPPDFAPQLHRPGGARVQILVDGTNSNSATVALGYAERIVQNFGAQLAITTPLGIDLRERAWFNPNLASRDYNVPAVIGSIILMVCLLMTSLAIVREREIGTLEQLMVSPLQPLELIAGKLLPFALIGLLDILAVTLVALAWFKVPLVGNFVVVLSGSVLFLLSALGIGLLVSAVSATQQEAFMTSFLLFMPLILLSGFMFPVTSMPELFHWLTLLNPLRHFLEIVRAVFLKGAGFDDLWRQFLALSLMGPALLWLAAGTFRKTAG